MKYSQISKPKLNFVKQRTIKLNSIYGKAGTQIWIGIAKINLKVPNKI